MKFLKSKKTKAGIAGILLGIVFLGEAVLLSLPVLTAQKLSTSFMIGDLAAMVVSLWLLNFLNAVYDTADGFASVHLRFGLWARNALFAGILWFFLSAMYRTAGRFYDAEAVSGPMITEGIVLMAVFAAVILYVHNARYLASRESRIHHLENEKILNGKRRWNLLAEGIVRGKGDTVQAHGRVNGEVHQGDRVLILNGNGEKEAARILRIEKDEKKVSSLSDSICDLTLLPRHTSYHGTSDYVVLSSVQPVARSEGETQVENPLLSGGLQDWMVRYQDGTYISFLNSAILHSHLLVPGISTSPHHQDIMDPMKNENMSFPAVNMALQPQEPMLAVFTDWSTLKRWGQIMAAPKAAVIEADFDQILNLYHQGYKGIVINPFGPVPFLMNKEYIDSLKASEEHQKMIREKMKEED